MVDDSIVRGTTSKQIVKMLYNAGAKEIYMRISSPPLMYPCFYGIDMATRTEFIANHRTIEEIRDYLGVDSLAYLSIEGLVRAIGEPKNNFCLACFNGDYPVDVSEILDYDKYTLDDDSEKQIKQEKTCVKFRKSEKRRRFKIFMKNYNNKIIKMAFL